MAAMPFAFATKKFADFDDEMRMTKAVTGAAANEFQVLTDTAERLGHETSFMAKQVAQGMTAMGRMGFSQRKSMRPFHRFLTWPVLPAPTWVRLLRSQPTTCGYSASHRRRWRVSLIF